MSEAMEAACDHPVWVTRILGGEPLSVSICQLCGDINWAELRTDFERQARAFAQEEMLKKWGRHEYPDGSVGLCYRGMINIQQVFRLFKNEPQQDFCDS